MLSTESTPRQPEMELLSMPLKLFAQALLLNFKNSIHFFEYYTNCTNESTNRVTARNSFSPRHTENHTIPLLYSCWNSTIDVSPVSYCTIRHSERKELVHFGYLRLQRDRATLIILYGLYSTHSRRLKSSFWHPSRRWSAICQDCHSWVT